jgi:LCP family protein required for cell wall assembly
MIANQPTAVFEAPYINRYGRFKRGLKRAFLIFLAFLIGTGGYLGWRVYDDAANATGNRNPLALLGILRPAQLDQTNGWTNILLAGYSADDPGHQGADLTDSIMVLSINQTTHQAVVVSIPRDLWVDMPGHGYQKINAAYEDGGMSLLEQVLGQDLGININYNVLINYTAFRDAVNAVGGVTVTINSSDLRGVYDPNTGINLPNGQVKLNGQEALALARSRGDGYGSYGFPLGDFNRIQYQQQMLLALKTKADSASVIADPFKVVLLANSVGNNVKTDLSTGQLETLYSATKKIGTTNIKTVTFNKVNGQTLLQGYTTYNGQSALIPVDGINDYTDIQSAIQQLF